MIYLRLIKYNILRFLAYPGDFVFILVKRILEVVMLVAFWNIIYQSSNDPKNVSETISYFLISGGLAELSMGRTLELVSRLKSLINNAELSSYLIKPIKIIPTLFALAIGGKAITNILAIIFIVLGIILLPNITLIKLFLFTTSTFVAIILGFFINLIIGSLWFYSKDVSSIRTSMQNLIRIFSGSLLPLYSISENYRNIFLLTPFPSLAYLPISILKHNTFEEALNPLLIGIIWCVFLGIVSILFWKRSLRFYDAAGI